MSEQNLKTGTPGTATAIFHSVLGWIAAGLLSIAGAFSAQLFNLPNLATAQISLGIFGLVGGYSHVRLTRTIALKISRRKGLLISIVWALACVGGVTPMFFFLGTSLKMSVLSLYSFAFFGALGGLVTGFMIRPRHGNTSSQDIPPYILTWALCFGIAAIAGDTLGEGLQKILPEIPAWFIASGVMVLILGWGSWYSIVSLLAEDKKQRTDIRMSSKENSSLFIIVLLLLVLPFYLNDFANIFVSDWRVWLFIDYTAVKLFPFLVILWLIWQRKISAIELGLSVPAAVPFLAVFLAISLIGVFLDQNGYPILSNAPGYSSLGGMPKIESFLWRGIDLIPGLLLVGVFEELIFRGYLYMFISKYTRQPVVIVCLSAAAFGLIHWSGGFHQVIVTAVTGAVFMMFYIRTRSLPAIMLGHFAVNFIAAASFIPKSIFRFF